MNIRYATMADLEDVYKRQVIKETESQTSGEKPMEKPTEKPAETSGVEKVTISGGTQAMTRASPVSYTHLDVYKRQIQNVLAQISAYMANAHNEQRRERRVYGTD